MNPYMVPPSKWDSTYGQFFKGYVCFIPEGILKNFFSKHKFLLEDGTIIKISTKNYLRFQTMQELLKGKIYFEILAPLENVFVIEGNINSTYIKNMSVAEFHFYRKLCQAMPL